MAKWRVTEDGQINATVYLKDTVLQRRILPTAGVRLAALDAEAQLLAQAAHALRFHPMLADVRIWVAQGFLPAYVELGELADYEELPGHWIGRAREAAAMPRYRVGVARKQFGETLPYDAETVVLAWPRSRYRLTPANDAARTVAAYYERYAEHPELPHAPWCMLRGGLYLPELKVEQTIELRLDGQSDAPLVQQVRMVPFDGRRGPDAPPEVPEHPRLMLEYVPRRAPTIKKGR